MILIPKDLTGTLTKGSLYSECLLFLLEGNSSYVKEYFTSSRILDDKDKVKYHPESIRTFEVSTIDSYEWSCFYSTISISKFSSPY